MLFVFRVEGGVGKRFLQVLLAPQTKLRGRGRLVRGEEPANLCSCIYIRDEVALNVWMHLSSSTLEAPRFLSPILPVVGCQVAPWVWQPLPVRRSQTRPLPRLPRGLWV